MSSVEPQAVSPRDLSATRTLLERPEQVDRPIDFSTCRTLDDVLREVKRMGARSEHLPTSDGAVKFSAKELAGKIERTARIAIRGMRTENPAQPRAFSPDELDDMLAFNGVTSTAGLREAMVRVMDRKTHIGAESLALMRELKEEGEFNPVNKLPLERFKVAYPRETVPLEVTQGMSDTEAQVVVRWQKIEQANIAKAQAEEARQHREFQDTRSRVGFRQEWITTPTSSDGFVEYGRAQRYIKSLAEDVAREALLKKIAVIEGPANQNSIADTIARVLGSRSAVFSYEGVNWVRGADRAPVPKITRTLALPIEGAPGHLLTITVLSEAVIPEGGAPREVPEHFQGVIVESVDELRVYAGEKAQTDEQRRVVELARAQMKRSEDRIRNVYKIDLGIEKKLASLLS